MNMLLARQYSDSVANAQSGFKLNAKGYQILAAVADHGLDAAFVATGLRRDKLNSERIRLFVHGMTIETRLDHVWRGAAGYLMGRIRFHLLNDDESLGELVWTAHFDEVGNINRTTAFADSDADLQKAAIRDILLNVLNAVHAKMETVDL